ncbi:MAG: hypothetical protein ACYDBQ_08760 [Thermoplasmatota archaeon]
MVGRLLVVGLLLVAPAATAGTSEKPDIVDSGGHVARYHLDLTSPQPPNNTLASDDPLAVVLDLRAAWLDRTPDGSAWAHVRARDLKPYGKLGDVPGIVSQYALTLTVNGTAYEAMWIYSGPPGQSAYWRCLVQAENPKDDESTRGVVTGTELHMRLPATVAQPLLSGARAQKMGAGAWEYSNANPDQATDDTPAVANVALGSAATDWGAAGATPCGPERLGGVPIAAVAPAPLLVALALALKGRR